MEAVTKSRKIEVKRSVQFEPEKGEIKVLGVRCLFMNPVSSCEKVDRMFGTGGEVIVHNVCFESGYELFEDMVRNNPDKSKENLLAGLVAVAPEMGHGIVTATTVTGTPPTVEVRVRNPAAKTVKGSQKHLVGGFWAGVLSKYFDRKMACKDYSYDEQNDELSCVIST